MKDFDAVIIGGGPAGSTAARFLAEGGARVALAERDLDHLKPCGGGFPSTGFSEFDLDGRAVTRTVKGALLVSPVDESLEVDMTGGSINVVDRRLFDKYLREKACSAGSELINGQFTGFSDFGPTIVSLIRKKNGRELPVRSSFVVGCDGVTSRVRKVLGLPPVRGLYTYSELIREVLSERCEFWFGSNHAAGSYSWVFPGVSGCSVGTGAIDPKRLKEYFDIFLVRRGITARGRGRLYKVPLWSKPIFLNKNVLLAGDSASQVMPLTYEGIYYSMKSAQFAARAILEGNISLYKTLWDKRFRSRFRFMRMLERYFLKNDINSGRLVKMFGHPAVQEASMNLWFQKDAGKSALVSYFKLFGKYLN